MRGRLMLLVGALSLVGAGCRSHQLARDQDHIRESVLELHTTQIMDNLVRARKGLPIIQLDYTNMTGTITHTGSGNVSGGQSSASNRFFASAGLARVLTNTVSGGGMAQQVNQLTISAQPVLNAPEVYNAYLSYLKVDDRLRETCEPPPCGAAIAVRGYCEEDCGDSCRPHSWWHKREKKQVYYWIPVEYRDDFRRLSLYTVAVRGQPTTFSPNFDVTVTGLVKEVQVVEGDPDLWELYFKLNTKIPNDNGYMIATINGKLFESKEHLKIVINLTDGLRRAQPNEPLSDNQQTGVIVLSVNLKTLGVTKADILRALDNKKVGIRLEYFAPSGSPTDRLLNDIRTQLELSRLGQLQP